VQAGRTISQQFLFATFVTSIFFDVNSKSHDTLPTAVNNWQWWDQVCL